MSTPNDHIATSNYLCHDCGTININTTVCIQCQSESLEEIPIETHDNQSTSAGTQQQQQQLSENNQTVLINHEFQNLFNNSSDIQTFSNMLLRMIMLQQPHRHRRGRPPRRIKRIANPPTRHRSMPFINLLPFQLTNTQTPQISLFDINTLLSEQSLRTQLEPSMALVQLPLQLVVFDPNEVNLNSDMLIQLLNEDRNSLPFTRNDINQLPTLTMTSSNLSVNPSCSICLENFDLLSEVKQLPICHHVFHTNCLTEWLLRHGTCPVCRASILLNTSSIQQIVSRTVQQPANNLSNDDLTRYSTIKTTQILDTRSNTIEPNHSSSNILQLPRFDSQTHTDSSSNRE